MTDLSSINALRILQSSDRIMARLAGEFSAIHGLSVSEYFLLLHLEQSSVHRLPRVELAKRMHVSASTITRMAAPMEKLGLVTRESDPRDARMAYVVLTKSGLERVGEARATFSKQAANIFRDRWSEEDLGQLAGLLDRLTSDMAGSLTH